ncbi:MAG: hypothetical protein SGILL_004473, partial [Bacillariaceae sp.]
MLKRSQSVSTASMSTMAENFNPNFFDPLDEGASPKRGYTSSMSGPSRERKKSKASYGRKTSKNEFSPLFELGFDSPQFAAMSKDKKSIGRGRLLQRGHSLPVFPSPCCDDDEDTVKGDQDFFDAPTMLISPRKRTSSQLFQDDVGASAFPPLVTTASLTATPDTLGSPLDLPTPLNEIQDRKNMFHVGASSDDDTIMSSSDISEESEDDGCLAISSSSERKVRVLPERRVLQPDNASTEDVEKT